jgi:hypothetical protein
MDTLSTARNTAKWMAYLGLACGVLYSGIGFFYDLLTVGLNTGTALAFMAIVGMPIMFGTVGFLFGALFSLLAGGVDAMARRLKG